jgi:hypothetical protein
MPAHFGAPRRIATACVGIAVVVALGCSHHKGSTAPAPPPAVTGSNLSSTDAGRAIFTNQCNACHSSPTITSYSASQWSSIIPNMSARANLTSGQQQQLTDYINSVLAASH